MHDVKGNYPKKVMLCIPSLALGGAEKFVVDLASHMDKTKYDVTVAITRNSTQTIFRDQLFQSKVRIVDLSGGNYFEMCVKQCAYLMKERPDVIHANVGSILHILLVCLFFPKIRKLYTVHNEPKLLYHDNLIKKAIYKFAFKCGGFIPVGISKTIQEEVAADFGLRIKETRVVNNGVDTELFSFNPIKKNQDIIEIITTGRLHKVKNQEQLIRVFSELIQVEPNLRLMVLGEGDTRAALEKQIHELGIIDYVSMPGMKKNVSEYLQQADIYVSTSLTEGLPLSILEAMSCGLPVVATDVGGTKDIVNDGVNGFMISKNDDKALYEAILKLVISKNLRNEMGNNAHLTSQSWSLTQCAENYGKLYDEEHKRYD